ncbi:MAG: SHOCT domain-containing protein [Oscillospiraceae bacterium]
MDDQTNVYSEKKLASFETIYKESVFSKPLDITVTITAAHIYGAGYICVQKGTKEDDPEYGKYVCGLEDITKISINNNNKSLPINVQCDEVERGVPSRKRIILPHFPNAEEVMRLINDAKADYDRKHAPREQPSEEERRRERERIKKAADEEFLNATADHDKNTKKSGDFTVADILGLDDFAPIVPEKKAEEPVKEEPVKAEPVKEEPVVEEPAVKRSDAVKIDSILEAAPEADVSALEEAEEAAPEAPSSDSFDEIVIPDTSDLPEAQAVENPGFIPSETIEAIGVVEVDEDVIEEPKIVVTHKTEAPKQPAPVMEAPKSEPKAEKAETKSAAAADIPTPKAGEKMSLEDFQTAVKKLKSMHDSGLLDDEEFAAEKSKLMKFLY